MKLEKEKNQDSQHFSIKCNFSDISANKNIIWNICIGTENQKNNKPLVCVHSLHFRLFAVYFFFL